MYRYDRVLINEKVRVGNGELFIVRNLRKNGIQSSLLSVMNKEQLIEKAVQLLVQEFGSVEASRFLAIPQHKRNDSQNVIMFSKTDWIKKHFLTKSLKIMAINKPQVKLNFSCFLSGFQYS